MFDVKFEIDSYDEKISGFDLGHMTLTLGKVSLSSKPYGSKKLMMIFISIIDMLTGLEDFLCQKKSLYEFTGTGSSYFLRFSTSATGEISVSQADGKAILLTKEKLTIGLYESVLKFWKLQKTRLDHEDPVLEDFETQLKCFSEIVKNCQS